MLNLFFILISVVVLILPASIEASEPEWLEVKDTNLIVRDGGPLDMSGWLPSGEAGSHGRIVIGQQGRFVFEQQKTETAKLHCASLAWSPITGGFPDRSMADIYAHQIKLHGYNLVRFHYVEASLMTGRERNYDFDPEQLDRFYYFLSALKKEGIYWLIDAMSSENGAMGNVQPHRWIQKHNLKFRVQFDEAAKSHWLELVNKLYARKNPYTGLSVLQDTALAGVILVNEGGVHYLALTREQGWQKALREPFGAWVKKKYVNDHALVKAWGKLHSDESIMRNSLRLPDALRSSSPRMKDFQLFLTELESDTARWMTSHIRNLGYSGPVTSYDNWISAQADHTRATLDWVDMHAYHDESLSYQSGSEIEQTSSLANSARYARWLGTARQADKPFSVSEYGQPFWNKYRYEAGAVMPALAAYQGWDFVCLHASGAIDLSYYQKAKLKSAIHPYGIGIDPIARAGETLAALLFMRGDVAPSMHHAKLDFSDVTRFTDPGLPATPDETSKIVWLTGVGLTKRNSKLEDFQDWVERSESLTKRVDAFRKSGVLNGDNHTDILAQFLESDTNQINLDTRNQRFVIKTPKTEAIASSSSLQNFDLNALKITSFDGPGLISVSSLDNEPLVQSRKMLLIFATDAENTGMRFAGNDRKRLIDLGKMPPRIRRGTADIFIKTATNSTFKLYSLHLNGEVGDALSVSKANGGVRFVLDNGTLSHGPTTFFLLEAN